MSMAVVSLASDLVLPIRPTGPRLIQPVAYRPGMDSPVEESMTWAVVGDNGLLVIERHAFDVLWVVANRAVDRLDWPIGELTGAGDIAVAVELRALGADGNNLAIFAQDFRRR